MSKREKMLAKIRELGIEVPGDAKIARTYAGSNQRSCGAWSWMTFSSLRPTFSCGSQRPITDVLAAPKIAVSTDQFGFIHLDPDPLPVRLTDFQKYQLRMKKQKQGK